MAFDPNPRVLTAAGNANAVLRFTITNTAAIPLTGLAFNHTLPGAPAGGLGVAGAPAFTPSCGAPVLNAAGTNINFTGGTVAPGQTCVVSIPVQAPALPANSNFAYPNAPVTLNSNEAPPVTAGPVIWTAQRNQ
jgi:hypothetical protein